jgi:hypothetical protein
MRQTNGPRRQRARAFPARCQAAHVSARPRGSSRPVHIRNRSPSARTRLQDDSEAIPQLRERVLAFVNNHFAGYAPETIRQLLPLLA